jgi:polyisoprenoid-binding protein YceI
MKIAVRRRIAPQFFFSRKGSLHMKKMILTAALAVSSLAFASSWEIDTTHASANFSVKHLGVSNTTGQLGPVTGMVELDDKDVTKSKIELSIDVNGIDTRNQKRDDHLKSPEFFDVAKFPKATFKSTKIEKAGEKFKVTGDLTMHGVTKSVTMDAEVTGEVENPFSKGVARAVTVSGVLNREDFGLSWNAPMANNGFVVGKEVKVMFEAELAKKMPAAPAAKAPAPAKK